MGLLKGGFKVVVCALLVDALAQPSIFRLPSEFAGVAEAATLPPGYDLPGFGGATATPRMLIIMDTSRSMASTPDMTKNLPLQDYDGQAESTMSPPICGEDPDTGRLPNSSGLSTTPGIPAQNTGAMQGTTLNLQCPAGQTIVQIDWAAYGKRENNVGGVARTAAVANFDESPPCSMTSLSQMRDTTALDGSGSCTDSMSIKQAGVNRGWVNITPKVENLCIGQESCSFVADDSLVGDPCYGTGYGKYALVSFRCSADPCPAGSGSKFCIAKKAMHRIVNDNAASNLEMSAGGYFQTNWSKYHPATNATYSTECVYDVIAKTTTTYNQGALKFSSSTEYGTVGTPALPGVPAMFACNPETFTGSNYATTCKAQPATHTCTKTFTYTADLVRFQHDDPMYRTVLPTGAPGSWTWGPGGDPADRLSDTPPHYFSNANSNWDLRDENRLYVPAADVGGTCAGGPATIDNVPLTAPPTHSTYPASCTATNPCTFFKDGMPNDVQVAVNPATIYFNAGTPPQTVRGLLRTEVHITPETEARIPASEFGGTCPAAPVYTGTLGYSCGPGDDRCELTRVGSSTPLVDYSCSPGYTLFDTNKCTATSVGNNSNLSVPSYVQDTSADSWSAYEYALDLPSVASGAVKCFDGSTESYPTSLFPAAGVGVLTQASLGCGGNDTSFPGRCAVKSNNTDSGFRDVFDQPILGRVLTDKQQVVCQVLKYQTHYTSVVPATANSYCKYTRNRYDWNNLETRCRYHRFDYRFNKKAFSYTWNYNDGDYAGYRTATPVYSSSAVDSDLYCSATRPVQPVNPSFTDGAGFTVPSGPTHCAAELAPGTDACPADALRCKLRWGSIGNQRFATFNTPTFDHPRSGHAQPGIGCAVGDPTPQASGDPKNHIGYDNVWADWCWSDPTRQPAHAAYSDPPKLIADIYNPAVPSGDFSGGYWSGVTPNSSDTFTPALHPMKDRGLSVSDIYPPTPAVSFSNFGEAKTDLLKLFKKNGAGGGTLGLQMPQYGDITPLSGALTNALDFLKQVKAADTSAGCRRYSILLVTDGNEDPEVPGGLDTVAAQLNTEGINTYVVGFGIASARLDTFARQVKTAVDGTGNLDLVNGHAYNASDYATLLTALNKIIGDQLNGYYTRSKPTLTSDSKRIYSGYFGHASGGPAPLEYQGYVDAYAIAGGAVSATPDWKFDQKLHAQTSAPHSSLPRRLFTRIPNTDHIGDFDVASACSGDAQKLVEGMMGSGSCGAKRGDANTIIEFVRNDRAAPDDATFGDGTAKYSRVSDVYHSQPAALYAPFFSAAYTAPTPYKELGGGGAGLDPASATSDFDSGKFTASYSAYKASHASRETTVFVGSNTGTVHAIRDDVTTTQTWRGEERWAYVPKQLLPRLGDARTTGHTWLADGSMALAEVCFGKTDCQKADGSGWVAMLIGTTGRGGPFVFGLDVTDVDAPNWLWDYNNDPASLHDTDMGQTWSAPVVARVRVDDDYYKWGVFMGGGYKDAPAEADYFYVLDADPSLRSSYHIQPMEDSHHDDAKFHVPGQNYVYAPWPFTTSVPNNVPGRPRVIRPNDGSRASRVYFGDTNGVIWSMDVTSKRIRDWDPDVLFNPFQMDHVNHGESSCRAASIDPLPDRASPPASLTLSSGTPSMSWPNLNLPAIYNRPYVGLDENTTATMLYVGTGDATNPLDMDTTNFFWAVEDGDTTTTSHCKGKLRWGYFLNKTTGEKVLSEPVVIGKNIIVAVYTPPSGGAGVCGAAGSSMLYCFDRLTGVPQNCLVDLSSSPADSTAAAHGGRGRFVRVGEPGIVSDLQAVGNRVVFTTSATPDKLSGNDVANVNSPFRIKSWRRVR